MNRRHWLPAVAILSLVLIAVTYVILREHRMPAITAENAKKIVPGMSLDEVRGLLGPPRMEPFDAEPAVEFDTDINYGAISSFWDQYHWLGENVLVIVTVNPATNTVTSFSITGHREAMKKHDLTWHFRRALGIGDTPTSKRLVPAGSR